MGKITIGMADDHVLFRKGMTAILEQYREFEIVLEADNGRELINKLDLVQPDVVLMDLHMPEMDGLEASRYIHKHHPGLRIIALSEHRHPSYIMGMIQHGARAYLPKNARPQEVAQAIYSVMRNSFYFNDLVSNTMLHKLVRAKKNKGILEDVVRFTNREREVLQLISREYTTEEIAYKLSLSHRTVEGHRRSMLSKAGARNIVGVIIYAMRNGMVD